jgi:hypothetical protein
VARIPYSGASIEPSVPGTTYFIEMADSSECFDFGSLTYYSTLFLRIGNLGIVTVLNDSGSVGRLLWEYLSHISGPISSIQLREIAAHFAYGNSLLVDRPTFWSELGPDGRLTIRSSPPIYHGFHDFNRAELGKLLAYNCAPFLRESCTPDVEKQIERLARGEIQFLYHDDGTFIS